MSLPSSPTDNQLLAALSAAELEAVVTKLELVSMPLGKPLYQPGEKLKHAYFPTATGRWLLSTLDRGAASDVVVTQELIASTLGVRREGVTDAVGQLKTAGLINYRRGHISVLDKAGLEARACECYAVVKAEMKRMLIDLRNHQGKHGAQPTRTTQSGRNR